MHFSTGQCSTYVHAENPSTQWTDTIPTGAEVPGQYDVFRLETCRTGPQSLLGRGQLEPHHHSSNEAITSHPITSLIALSRDFNVYLQAQSSTACDILLFLQEQPPDLR